MSDDDDLPQSPISKELVSAIEMYQSMMNFQNAGFTAEQSFSLIQSIVHGMAVGMAARGDLDEQGS